jgi:hypothetical protein
MKTEHNNHGELPCVCGYQPDILPDMSQELASMGRGSMQRRIQLLEQALAAAETVLDQIASDNTDACDKADRVLGSIQRILRR